MPIAQVLINEGFDVFRIDASPTHVAAFRGRFPGVPVACEAAPDSAFFNRTFDAAVCVGPLLPLTARDQRTVIRRIANVLEPGGRLLFGAPIEIGKWRDVPTGRCSTSLGSKEYEPLLRQAGLQLVDDHVDEGQNHHYDAAKPPA